MGSLHNAARNGDLVELSKLLAAGRDLYWQGSSCVYCLGLDWCCLSCCIQRCTNMSQVMRAVAKADAQSRCLHQTAARCRRSCR